jgi:hypothetical protein
MLIKKDYYQETAHTLAFKAEMGILQTIDIDEAGSVSASAEECGSAQETRLRCHLVMLWHRDAIVSCGAKGQSVKSIKPFRLGLATIARTGPIMDGTRITGPVTCTSMCPESNVQPFLYGSRTG